MIKKISIILFFGILFFSSSILAYEIQNFNTEIEVYDDGESKVVNYLILDSINIKETFSIPAYSPESVIVSDDKGELKFATLGTNIIIRPRKRMKNYEVTIQYLTNRLTSKKEDKWSVSYLIPAYEQLKIDDIKEAGLILSLPNTATINTFPEKGIIFSEHNRIKIGWKLQLKKDKDTKIEIEYNNNPELGEDWTKFGFYALSAIIIIVILAFCIKIGYCKLTKRISKGKKDIIKTLEKREKEVINLLLKNNNQLYQSKIQKDTSISKATLSRIIKRLESRNIIEVRPSGNTNLIIVQEWFSKK